MGWSMDPGPCFHTSRLNSRNCFRLMRYWKLESLANGEEISAVPFRTEKEDYLWRYFTISERIFRKITVPFDFQPMSNPLGLSRDSPPKSSPTITFSVRPRSSVGRVTVDLIQRSWVRFPPRSKDFFFTSCGSLIPFTRANAQWVTHGFN